MSKVCVIMSVYKNDNNLSFYAALDSINSQTHRDVIVYLCKDGPLPKELEDTLALFSEKLNMSVFSNQVNIGLAASLNILIDEAIKDKSIKYIARMDSDDVAYPERIEEQVKYMINNNIQLCGSFCREFGASYALTEKQVPVEQEEIVKSAVTRCPFIHPTVVFDVEVFKDGVRYPEDTVFTEDMALWLKLIRLGVRMGNCPKVLLDYRINENTVKRRLGWGKGVSEFKLRYNHMKLTQSYSIGNIVKLFMRLPFHILPASAVKLMYKYGR